MYLYCGGHSFELAAFVGFTASDVLVSLVCDPMYVILEPHITCFTERSLKRGLRYDGIDARWDVRLDSRSRWKLRLLIVCLLGRLRIRSRSHRVALSVVHLPILVRRIRILLLILWNLLLVWRIEGRLDMLVLILGMGRRSRISHLRSCWQRRRHLLLLHERLLLRVSVILHHWIHRQSRIRYCRCRSVGWTRNWTSYVPRTTTSSATSTSASSFIAIAEPSSRWKLMLLMLKACSG